MRRTWMWSAVVAVLLALAWLALRDDARERTNELPTFVGSAGSRAIDAPPLDTHASDHAASHAAPSSSPFTTTAHDVVPDAANAHDDSQAIVPATTTTDEANWPDPALLEITVVDRRDGRPIADAHVTGIGFIGFANASAALRWTTEPKSVVTDAAGRAVLPCPRRTLQGARIAKARLRIVAPEFAPAQVEIRVDQARCVAEIPLDPVAIVCFSGWIESPSRLVTDVEVVLFRRSSVDEYEWTRDANDLLCSASLSVAGQRDEHDVRLTHTDRDGVLWSSRTERFRLGAGERREITLELFRRSTVRGRLDDRVPRPIASGVVLAYLSDSLLGSDPPSWRTSLDSQGRFELHDVPPGRIEIRAWTDGWCGWSEAREFDERREDSIQSGFEIPRSDDCVVRMTETGSVHLKLHEAGKPVSGAVVNITARIWGPFDPPEFWMGRPDGTTRTTDAQGRVQFDDVPLSDLHEVRIEAYGLVPVAIPEMHGRVPVATQAMLGVVALYPCNADLHEIELVPRDG